ncbi:transposase [Stappia sp. BW2]|uniref:integrase core domain-containing protein n=1 Tax=Stappia sp. BW2 TaxID=2592622 RepID=UPI0011DEC848|nr:transposase [Stappia sp. BW2]
MTDNGAGYRSSLFATTLQRTGARPARARSYRPQPNGKAERFIKILQEEWAYGMSFGCSEQTNAGLPRWLNIDNCQRPHGGDNFNTPISL